MRQSSRDIAYAGIRQKALLGELPMGGRLSEETLAREFGISRTPVREALNQLTTEGLLEQIPRYGTFVKKLGRDDIEELYDMRAMFEGYAAERAATRITHDQLRNLQHLCDEFHRLCVRLRDGLSTPADQNRIVLNDVAFHLLILHAAGSKRLMKMVDDMKILTNICGRQWIRPEKYRPYWVYLIWGNHLRIYRALSKRDPALARQKVMNHILQAKEGVLKAYDTQASTEEHKASLFKVQDWPESLRQVIESMERFSGGPSDA